MDSRELDGLIDELETTVEDAAPLRTKWKPVWEQIRAIAAGFKGSRYPSREEREAAWTRFQSLIDRVKEIQSQENQLRESMRGISERYRDEIIARAHSAIPPSGFEEGLAGAFLAPINMFSAAFSRLLPGSPVDEHREMLNACSEVLREGWGLLSRYKSEMLGHHKQEAFEALSKAKEILDNQWARWKETQQEAYEARCQIREEREAKRAAWKERAENNIGNLRQRLERLLEILANRETHLEELREKRDTAWNDEFRERVEGWIDEEEENIQGIREKIECVEGWLEEQRVKLS
ncbi:MAG: hypothetical protein Q8O71_03925 [bacterium]|nr:hypothetical protein [bacterium]